MPFITPTYLKTRYGPNSGNLPVNEFAVCGTSPWVMWHPAARCHRAMMAAAREAGFDPRSTGTYRSYERQVALFRERYSIGGNAGGCKVWNGLTWCKHLVNGRVPADAAVPGTSEHGWGCADDIAQELDGDIQPESISQAFYLWLAFHAPSFGFENTNRSERWHWAYVLGGEIPQRVLDYERPPSPPPPPQPPSEEDEVKYLHLVQTTPGQPEAIVALDGSGVTFVALASPSDAMTLIERYQAVRTEVTAAQYAEFLRVARAGDLA